MTITKKTLTNNKHNDNEKHKSQFTECVAASRTHAVFTTCYFYLFNEKTLTMTNTKANKLPKYSGVCLFVFLV